MVQTLLEIGSGSVRALHMFSTLVYVLLTSVRWMDTYIHYSSSGGKSVCIACEAVVITVHVKL